MRKFRISMHGTTGNGNWFCIQQKTWYGWKTITKYINHADTAQEIIKVMQESEK